MTDILTITLFIGIQILNTFFLAFYHTVILYAFKKYQGTEESPSENLLLNSRHRIIAWILAIPLGQQLYRNNYTILY